MISNDDHLQASWISDHMKQCWKEKADERSCYSSFLHIVENLYSSDATSDITYISRGRLRFMKYAPLAIHVDSFGNLF